MEATAVKKPVRIILQIAKLKTSGKKSVKIRPQAIEPTIPPIKPMIDLFGLAAKNPLVFLPKRIPKNQADESHIITKMKNKTSIKDSFGSVLILVRKVVKYPI